MEPGAPRGGFTAAVAARIRAIGPGTLLFALALLVACVALIAWLSHLTFWRDEWAFILDRRGSGIDVYLKPFVEQLLALAVAIYKLLIALFGIDSPLPFQLAHVAVFAATMTVVFVYVRRRVGEWLALAALLPILFLGPSWDDLLFPFQISFIGALGCGVGALLALDREDRRGDVIASVLLLVGLFFQHVAIPFVVAAAIDIGLTRERFRRAFVVVVPTMFWLLWYVGWGRDAQNFVSLHNFETLIGYVGDGLASSLSTLSGLAVPRDEMVLTPLDWGRPLLVIVVGLGAWAVMKTGFTAMPRRLWAVIAAQLMFWSLTGLNASFFGEATSGRYQIVGVVLWVMIFAELVSTITVRRYVVGIVLAASVLAALANFSLLRQNANGLAGIAEQERGGLAALELTRAEVAPDFVLTQENSGVDYLGIVDAASYFSAIDDFGSPAYTSAELAAAPEVGRVAADMVFAAALRLHPVPPGSVTKTDCTPVELGGGGSAITEIPPGGFIAESDDAQAELRLRRYATDEFPVKAGRVRPGEPLALPIPVDGSNEPWELGLTGSGTVSVCGIEGRWR